jgi:hypothetical protein
MKLPRTVEINGRRIAWRELLAARRAQAEPPAQQPALFDLQHDRRPDHQRSAAARYREPTLFDGEAAP